MKEFLALATALSDPTRVRALLLLAGGDLCLCQVIDVLGLAPSTVSRHMSLLHAAGLVTRWKEGKWQYFRLAGTDSPRQARQALAWARRSLAGDPVLAADAARLRRARKKKLETLCACYRC